MAYQTNHPSVVAIVPAFNEEHTIASVLQLLCTFPRFKEVIVVDDGSTDATADIAARFPVRLIRNSVNRGKGAALQRGVDACTAPILYFCDADMRGFTHDTISEVLKPVLSGELEMVIATRDWRPYHLGFIFSLFPGLGGQRALTRRLWDNVAPYYKEGYRIESALNFYARYHGRNYRQIIIPALSHMIKEQKLGFLRGLRARIQMSYEVVMVQTRLRIFEGR